MSASMQPSSSKGYGKVASGLIRSLSLEETSMDGSQQKSQEKPRKPTRKKATPIFEDVPSSPPSPEPARVLPRTQRNEKNREILLGHKGTPARETKKNRPASSRPKSPIRTTQPDDSDEGPISTVSTVREDDQPPTKRRALPGRTQRSTSQSSALTKSNSNASILTEPIARQRSWSTTHTGSPGTITSITPKTRILPWNRPASTTPAQTKSTQDVPMSDASIKTDVRSPTPQKRSFDEANEEPVKPRVRIVEPFEEDPSDSDESEPENPPNTPFMIIGHQLNTCKPPPNVEEEPLSVRARFSIKKRPDRYWNGQIGHTFLRKNKSQSVEPSNVPIWSIQDVLGEDHLSLIKTAIISTYELDVQFAAEYFPPGKIPTIMIAPRSYKTEIEKTQIVDWVFPELPGPPRQKECFHMKFMLLFFEEFVRVVIGSPNLIFADWNIIENTLWIQDVPLRPSGFIPTDHPFASTLTEVLEELGVGDALKRLNQRYPLTTLDEPSDLIEFYSWHRVKAALVHSFAGDQVGWSAVTSTGQFRLRRALKEIKARCPAGMELELECQTSEIGFRYGGAWLNIFYECAMGLNPMNRWGESRSEKGMVHPPRPPIKILYPGLRVFGKIWSHIQDEMPTKQLEKSVRGYRNAKGWLKTNYPRELFFSQRSLRGKDVFVHTKMIIGIFRARKDAPVVDQQSSKSYLEGVDAEVGGWVYLGSHNFTPAAWGRVGGSVAEPKQHINNYELGILLPLPATDTSKAADKFACWDRRKLTRYNENLD